MRMGLRRRPRAAAVCEDQPLRAGSARTGRSSAGQGSHSCGNLTSGPSSIQPGAFLCLQVPRGIIGVYAGPQEEAKCSKVERVSFIYGCKQVGEREKLLW